MMRRFSPRTFTITAMVAVVGIAALAVPPMPTQAHKPTNSHASTGGESSDKGGSTASDAAKEIEKLKEEIRQLKEQLGELRSRSKSIESHLTYGPEVEVQNEDYVQARGRFRTRLAKKGLSPQPWSPLKVPASVTEIGYKSGDLSLKAWINRPADEKRKYPAVLFLHGGFAFAMDDWEQTKPYRDAGFVVLAPMLRGENGQPGSWSY